MIQIIVAQEPTLKTQCSTLKITSEYSCNIHNFSNIEADFNFYIENITLHYITITKLNIYSSNLSRISNEIFEKLNSLKDLNVAKQHLQKLEKSYFNGAIRLQLLNLGGNKIEQIDSNVFENCPVLENLNLENNNISDINGNAFNGLTMLKILNLKENKITTLHDDTFKSLLQLTELNLSSNKIKKINTLLFESNRNLATLAISDNLVTEIQIDFYKNLTMLKKLSLSNNVCINRNFSDEEDRRKNQKMLRACNTNYNSVETIHFQEEAVNLLGALTKTHQDLQELESATDAKFVKFRVLNWLMFIGFIFLFLGVIYFTIRVVRLICNAISIKSSDEETLITETLEDNANDDCCDKYPQVSESLEEEECHEVKINETKTEPLRGMIELKTLPRPPFKKPPVDEPQEIIQAVERDVVTKPLQKPQKELPPVQKPPKKLPPVPKNKKVNNTKPKAQILPPIEDFRAQKPLAKQSEVHLKAIEKIILAKSEQKPQMELPPIQKNPKVEKAKPQIIPRSDLKKATPATASLKKNSPKVEYKVEPQINTNQNVFKMLDIQRGNLKKVPTKDPKKIIVEEDDEQIYDNVH